jgi:tRNA1(Val) A37 N6-methylase TrmN6
MNDNRLTGSYYTCQRIAEYLTSWAIRAENDSFLEPSFGDGVFVEAAISRYQQFNINNEPQIFAIELQPAVYSKYMENANIHINGFCQEFMTFNEDIRVSSVVGNPPYISLRNLDENVRATAIDCVAHHKIRMLASGSLWMPFTIHASDMLEAGGRIAFVLPFEITYVKYAYALWEFMSNNFSEITISRIHEDFFPDVDVETVLLMADGYGGNTDCVESYIFEDVDSLFANDYTMHESIKIKEIVKGKKPFILSLLNAEQQNILSKLRNDQIITPVIEHCKFNIGYVSADKDYFHPNQQIIKQFKLPTANFRPCICNAKDVNGGTGVGVTIKENQCTSKLYLPSTITSSDKKYIKYGVENGVHLRYKCQQRSPWYLTPSVDIPDVILTVFGDVPKLFVNEGKYAVSNSLLAGRMIDDTSPEKFVCMWYNSLTLLSIELNIHSLGGGVLVLIPGEADRLEVINDVPLSKIDSIFKRLDESIKNDGLQKTYELGDRLILKDILHLSDHDIFQIQSAVVTLRHWRKTNDRRIKR